MKTYKYILAVIITSYAFSGPTVAFAHPGRTAADGCHYCRTNCDRWGVPWNERHCHGGSSSPAKSSPLVFSNTSCREDSLWASLAPGEQKCGYRFWDWATGWGLVYGIAGWLVLSYIKKDKDG